MMTVQVPFLACVLILVVAREVHSQSANVDTKADEKTSRVLDRVVRHLGISGGSEGCFTIGDDREVCYLKPHESTTRIDPSKNYLGFTLYKRGGKDVEPGGGLFHFVEDIHIKDECASKHGDAFHYIYGSCPEDENKLVASGYCYMGNPGRNQNEGYNFKSNTLNNQNTMLYLDESYYYSRFWDSTPVGEMHETERARLEYCLAKWNSGSEEGKGWKCDFSAIPSDELRRLALVPIKPHIDKVHALCEDCQCLLPDVNDRKLDETPIGSSSRGPPLPATGLFVFWGATVFWNALQ